MGIKNFGMGRTFFFDKGTKEVKILDNKPDLRGMYLAKITNLVTGNSTLRPVSFAKGFGPMRIDFGLALEIH